LKFDGKKCPGYEKGQDAAKNVKDQVYQMVPPYIEPVEMIIDGKGEHSKNPGYAYIRANSSYK